MLAWLFFFIMLAVEVIAVAVWLRREYYPVFFSGWAATIYAGLFALDTVLTRVVSMLSVPGGTTGTLLLVCFGVAVLFLTFLFTLLFMWVVRQDLGEPPPDRR